jgi:hypothetical protein
LAFIANPALTVSHLLTHVAEADGNVFKFTHLYPEIFWIIALACLTCGAKSHLIGSSQPVLMHGPSVARDDRAPRSHPFPVTEFEDSKNPEVAALLQSVKDLRYNLEQCETQN